MFFHDSRVVARHGDNIVLDRAQSVVWRDGSSVQLHRVQVRDCDQTFLRALRRKDGQWLVFDLRAAARSLNCDLRSLLERDHDGAVLFTLRQEFLTAAALEARALTNALAIWTVPTEQLDLDFPPAASQPRVWLQESVQATA